MQVARWRPLVAWLLAIPHFIVAYALQILGEVMGVISWFAILFTGKLPESIAGVQCMCLRYSMRTQMYAAFLFEPYPPFTFSTTGADPGDLDGLRIDFQPALENRNRLTTFFRLLLVIPHLIVLMVLGIGAFVVLTHRLLRGALHAHLAHVRDVEQAGLAARVQVLGAQPVAILHRHLVARERGEACSELGVQPVEDGPLFRHTPRSAGRCR